ncbi:MAG: serine hydrolase domain-containing protein, partial [Ilumatobacteraceae bacterium]
KHASPALAWGVMIDGRMAMGGGAGTLDDGRAPTAATAFRIASMTKSFTAATVLALRDEGVVPSLDTVVPGVTPPTSDSPPITLRLLLSMSAGFAEDDPWADRHLDIDDEAFDAVVAAGITYAVAPATHFEYSNLGYGLVGRFVTRLAGEPIQVLTTRHLLEPLGLSRTTWTAPTDDDWARPHRLDDGEARPDAEPLDDGALAPMGGLWSNVEDLVSWMSWLDDAFPARDNVDTGPLRRSSRRELQQVHRATALARGAAGGEGLDLVPERIDGGGYGFGHQVLHDDRFGSIVGHSGGLPGYGSNMRWLPGRRVGAVALANSTYAPMRTLTRRMLEILDDHGLVPAVAPPLTPAFQDAASRLVALLHDWDDDAAAELFSDNVALDEPYDRRSRTAAALVDGHGPLAVTNLVQTSATEGTISLVAANGRRATVELMLSPHVPPLIQKYVVR